MVEARQYLNQNTHVLINGEGGIRTLGTALRSVQQISNLPLSTTQPPLLGNFYHHNSTVTNMQLFFFSQGQKKRNFDFELGLK